MWPSQGQRNTTGRGAAQTSSTPDSALVYPKC
jgi:hypothetical protein